MAMSNTGLHIKLADCAVTVKSAREIGFVYAGLKDIVMNCRVRPREHLHAQDFADRLKVSVTPVREAFIKLHTEGFIALVPNQGFYSKALDLKEQIALHEFAFLIMMDAVRRETGGFPAPATNSAIAVDIDCHASPLLDPTSHLSGHALCIERLFQQIAALSGNPEMIKFTMSFCDRTHYIRVLELEDPANVDAAAQAIRSLAGLVQARDVKRTTNHLNKLFENTLSHMAALVKEGNSRALAADFP